MKLKHFSLIFLLTLLLPACKSDEPAIEEKPVEKTYVKFSIVLSQENPGARITRAGDVADPNHPQPDNGKDEEWGTDHPEGGNHYEEIGTVFDNTIKSITPVLYSVSGNKVITSILAGTMDNSKFNEDKDENGITQKVTFTGELNTWLTKQDLLEGKYRLAVYVNATSDEIYQSINPQSPISTPFYLHGQQGEKIKVNGKEVEFKAIPMYGVGEVSFAETMKDYNPANASMENPLALRGTDGSELSIPVLRSMAKIRVKVDQEKLKDRNVEIQSLSISRHATAGYVVPRGWNTTSSVASLTTYSSFNPNTDLKYREEGCTHTSKDETKKSIRIYLPETLNCNNDGNEESDPIEMTIRYTLDGDGNDVKEHKFYLTDGAFDSSNTAKHWDIFRNTVYDFIIEGVEAASGNLNFNVSIKPWEDVKMPEIEY